MMDKLIELSTQVKGQLDEETLNMIEGLKAQRKAMLNASNSDSKKTV